MILGASGNVGAYAVQLAVNAGLQVIGVAGSKDIEYLKALGSQTVVNYQAGKFENAVPPVDLVLDTVGGETRGTLIQRHEIRWSSCFCRVH